MLFHQHLGLICNKINLIFLNLVTFDRINSNMQDNMKYILLEDSHPFDISPLMLIHHAIECKNIKCGFPNCHLSRVQCHHIKHCCSSPFSPCSSGFCLEWKRLIKQNNMNIDAHSCPTCPQPIKVIPSDNIQVTRLKRANTMPVNSSPFKRRRMSSATSIPHTNWSLYTTS